MDWGPWLAVIPAAGAAAAFGSAGLLQHRASHRVEEMGPLRPALLVRLVRIPSFVWSVVLSAVGFALQIVALRFGPLAIVQPLLATGVLFYLGIASAMMRKVPDWRLVGAALLVIAGLSGFLLSANPSEGNGHISGPGVWPLAAGLAAALVACLVASARLERTYRVLVLATATAICYGVTAGLVRSLTVSVDLSILAQWQLYAIIVLGPAGFLLNQNAYQAGNVGSLAVAITTVGDPVVAILVGALWLGEALKPGPGFVAAQVVSLIVLSVGIFFLTRRSQVVGERIASSDLPEAQ